MNAAQQRMLEKYGNNILMIDSTHGTNPYQIQLTTLMAVDGDYEGFPVAILWSKVEGCVARTPVTVVPPPPDSVLPGRPSI
jgi:hypothetical protein